MKTRSLRFSAMAAWFLLGAALTAAQNPLGRPAAQQRPFAGSFAGEKISLEMNWDAAQDAYTGWLTFQGKRYACGGLVNNSVLSGKFVADGTPYAFSVSIANDGTMTLTSDGLFFVLLW